MKFKVGDFVVFKGDITSVSVITKIYNESFDHYELSYPKTKYKGDICKEFRLATPEEISKDIALRLKDE